MRITALQLVLFFCTGLYLQSGNAAANSSPFSIRNLNPFILVYGLPDTENAELKTLGESASALTLDIINNSMITTAGNESISLDGETYRLTYIYRYGVTDNTEIGLQIPMIAHDRGFLDNFIEGWHDTFGLTNAERDKTPSNSLNYQYSRNGNTLMQIDQENEGIGDIRLFAARQLMRSGDSALSLHVSLKLPTGAADELHGSDATDASISLAHIKRRWLTGLQLSSFASGGLLFLGKGEVLSAMQKDTVAFGSAGLIWDNHPRVDLKAQIDFHSRIYDSELAQLGSHTIVLTVGGAIHISPDLSLDLGIGENLFTDTMPDFTINLAIKSGF